jgi:hypothetical protein
MTRMELGPKTKAMLRELVAIVDQDPKWPGDSMTTIFFRRRGVLEPEKVPVVDLLEHVGGEQIPPQLWFYLPAWETTVQFSNDRENAKTWLIQKLTLLAET